jgi:hypothetical protein
VRYQRALTMLDPTSELAAPSALRFGARLCALWWTAKEPIRTKLEPY